MKTPLLRYRLSEPMGLSTKICAGVIVVGGTALSFSQPYLGLMLVAFGILPFLFYKCLEINFYEGTYCLGVNVLGKTFGNKEPYPGVKCIFLKKNRTIHRASRHSWRQTASTSFDGFLWLEDETKILLSQDSTKEIALLKLEPFAQELQVGIKDLTAPLSQA
jgi:hypothetical protein